MLATETEGLQTVQSSDGQYDYQLFLRSQQRSARRRSAAHNSRTFFAQDTFYIPANVFDNQTATVIEHKVYLNIISSHFDNLSAAQRAK